MKNKITFLMLALMLVISGFTFAQITILSGPEQGSYYTIAGDIVKAVAPTLGTPIINKPTSGAAYNFEQLADPESPYKIALIQSDYLFYMQAMDSRDNTEKTKNFKVVLPLANEEIHLVTKAQNGIMGLQDLNDKTVAIGTIDQGTYATANLIKDRSEVYWTSRNIHFDQAMNDLHMDHIDAFFFVGSAPVAKLDLNPQAMADDLALVPLEDFNGWARYYQNDTIFAGEYKWLEQDVPTFAVRTLLVVNEAKLTPDDKNKILKLKMAIQNKFDELKMNGHPKWSEVDFSDWDETDWPLFK
ncbi:MAG: TAXI family TRAP transporter solute-binding subunit [Bacteroidales bacterium]|nr:TAXI family TRAP transporter solute-binding subunit [Bacteroidales bacterium]